ncbi:uncharacterized protein [Diadema setosum]|uniref:uncharacterized protein n=1 Tax=Diadema setosum TaxID=31175 RepID=UPI003B3BBEE5
MPRPGSSVLMTGYFREPWIEKLFANFDPRLKGNFVKPERAVAQIINVKETTNTESSGTELIGAGELHDSYVRAHAVFTRSAVEQFEKEEEFVSGYEFEHLPHLIVILKEFTVVQSLSEQLSDCNLVICIQSFCFYGNDNPVCKISSLPPAISSGRVKQNLQRLWCLKDAIDEGTENTSSTQTNSDSFLTVGLSELLVELEKNSTQNQTSQRETTLLRDDAATTTSGQTSSLMPVTKSPQTSPVPGDGDALQSSSSSSESHHIAPESTQGQAEDGSNHGNLEEGQEGREEQMTPNQDMTDGQQLTWKEVHQLTSWVFQVPLQLCSSADRLLDSRVSMIEEEVVNKVNRCLENLKDYHGNNDSINAEENGDERGSNTSKVRLKDELFLPWDPYHDNSLMTRSLWPILFILHHFKQFITILIA